MPWTSHSRQQQEQTLIQRAKKCKSLSGIAILIPTESPLIFGFNVVKATETVVKFCVE